MSLNSVSVAQRVFMVKTYTQTRSYVQTKHLFKHKFPNSFTPSKFGTKWNCEKWNQLEQKLGQFLKKKHSKIKSEDCKV